MYLLTLANKNFYIFMVVVICILLFLELKECKYTRKKDRYISIALIFIYSIGTLGIFVFNIFC